VPAPLGLDRVLDRLLARLRAGGPFPPEFPVDARPGPEPDRLDRVLAESSRSPLVLRFEGAALPGAAPAAGAGSGARRERGSGGSGSRTAADDLDRLRLEFESTLLRIPNLRGHPVDRIELRFASDRPAGDLAGFLRALRSPLPAAAASAPVIAELDEIPGREVIGLLAAAGCTHASISGPAAGRLLPAIDEFRASGFRGIVAELGPEELHSTHGLLGVGGPDGFAIRSPLEALAEPEERLRDRLRATIRAAAALREAGLVDAAPRRFRRGGAIPGFATIAEAKTRLGFGPGALRLAGAPMDAHLWRSANDPGAWAEAIDHGRTPPGVGHRPGEEERLRRFAIRSLLGTGRLDIVELERRGKIDFIHRFENELAALDDRQHDGLVECDPDEIRATELGRLVIEDIAGCFDPARLARERVGAV